MTQCQIELMNAGGVYPRTCQLCGLGGACVKGLERGIPDTEPTRGPVFDANGWCHDMDAAPRDGENLLIWFSHGADPYHIEETGKLTDYAAWAEIGDFVDGEGVCIGRWFEQLWESVDEYGNGYWLPAAWFALENDDFERVVNPVAWRPLPLPPVKEQDK